MNSILHRTASIVFAACLAGTASAHHHHLTADTLSGRPGDRILIRAGYYFDEADVSIEGGRLLDKGEILVVDLDLPLTDSGPYSGWTAGDELVLTSDFFAATGRLNGGNFMYDLSSVHALSGGPGVLAWGDFADKGKVEPFIPLALSDAATRVGRSFDTGAGGHDDLQGLAFSAPGLYDVTFIVWDSNGRYTDSDPVTVRFNVVPTPGVAAMFGIAGLASLRRRSPGFIP